MKSTLKTTVILIFALALSIVITGCAGCGNDTNKNTNDMVESTPAVDTRETIVPEESTLATETFPASEAATDGGNATANDITGTVDENGNHVDESGNIIDDAGNIINDAGNAIGNAADNVGNAVKDVVDGVGNGVRDLTR